MKSHGLERNPSEGDISTPPKPQIGAYGEETINSDDDEDYDLDDDELANEMSTEWNLRKCAAAALDVLAVRFSGDLLNVLLGPLKDKLWSSDWLQRESGILALGAMAEGRHCGFAFVVILIIRCFYCLPLFAGCIEAIEQHLPTLVPYLINTLSDPKARIFHTFLLRRYLNFPFLQSP
jgi:transportin-1